VLKPGSSGANGSSCADAERTSSLPLASRTWKAILVS
jgi:hypothetical protein